ncbi:hypothetical protein QM453_09310 [Streptococcus mitis]|jgi:hypothetical protein|uniref:hypothetical protein n=1 Tax=Streptococcus mitis TaxID=28037 RepID=UPI0039C16F8E
MIKIEYLYTDVNNRTSRGSLDLGNLEIAKHFILAGAGFVPRKDVLRKALAALTYFESYFPNDAEETEYFLKPQGWEYDPTQVAHFSNIVGKALADKFFRKFVRGIISFNYEAVMKSRNIPIQGKRPDLYGISNKGKYFAIEAKGYSQTTSKRYDIKKQAESGPLYKDYSIASVTENIYSNISVDFYDPFSEDNLYKIENEQLIKDYYHELIDSLNVKNSIKIKQNEDEYIVIGKTFFKGDIICLAVLSSIFETYSIQERSPKINPNYFIDIDGFGVFKVNDDLKLVTYEKNEI